MYNTSESASGKMYHMTPSEYAAKNASEEPTENTEY
jgi:hypothetical protein